MYILISQAIFPRNVIAVQLFEWQNPKSSALVCPVPQQRELGRISLWSSSDIQWLANQTPTNHV